MAAFRVGCSESKVNQGQMIQITCSLRICKLVKDSAATSRSVSSADQYRYAQRVGDIIAKAQITNGGPIILVQPENEYSVCGLDILLTYCGCADHAAGC